MSNGNLYSDPRLATLFYVNVAKDRTKMLLEYVRSVTDLNSQK